MNKNDFDLDEIATKDLCDRIQLEIVTDDSDHDLIGRLWEDFWEVDTEGKI